MLYYVALRMLQWSCSVHSTALQVHSASVWAVHGSTCNPLGPVLIIQTMPIDVLMCFLLHCDTGL